jgi:hypothetical protein
MNTRKLLHRLAIFCAWVAACTGQGATSIGISEPEPPGGTTARLPVSLVGDQQVLAMQVDVLFSDAQYSVSQALEESGQPVGVKLRSQVVEPGRLRVVMFRGSSLTPLNNGVLFRIPLTAKSGVVDPDPVVLTDFLLVGPSGGTVTTSILPKVRLATLKDDQKVNGRIGVEITATASATGGTVSRVDYYVGGQFIGSGIGPTFSFVWMPPTSGPFELTAIAFDSNGLQASSRTVPVVVQHVGTFAGAITGTYLGLIRTPTFNFSKNGYASLTSSTTGAFTAKLTIGGVLISTSGKFDATGVANVTIPKTTTRPVWQLTLTESSAASVSQIHGRLTDGTITAGRITGSTFIAEFTADKVTWNSKTNIPPQAGAYTVLMPAVSDAAIQAAPLGDGYATATVATSGAIAMTGKLADNTAWSQSTYLSKDGIWPLYSLLYSSKGMALGELQFRDIAGVSDLDGKLDWFRPATVTTATIPFKPGFKTQIDAVGSRYVKPPSYARMMKTPNAGGNTMLTIQDGGLASPLVDLGTLKTSHTVLMPLQSSERATLKPVSTTGAVSGTFVHPGTQATTSFYGALLQKQNVAMGYFMSGLNSGGFSAEPNPQFTLVTKDGQPNGIAPIPVVKITKPVAESTLAAAASIVVSGTASDAQGVAAVELQVLHNGVLSNPTAATGTTAWSYTIPVPTGEGGRYQVFAKVRDTAGNESDISEVGFWMTKKTPLVVAVSGPGSVSSGYLGTTQRDAGKLVTITATPASKKKFIGWTGSVVSSAAKITFLMKDGMTLTATFQ